MPTSDVVRRTGSERLEVPALSILSSGATHTERVGYIRKHLRAMEACGRRTIQHGWLVGRELLYVRESKPELRGRTWDKFLKDDFGIGERYARELVRVHRAFPSVKSIPKGVESVRGAVAHLRAETEICQAMKRVADGRLGESNTTDTPVATQFFPPPIGLPSSSRIRAELRATQQELLEIAATDRAAFKQVREYVHRQHQRVQRKSKAKASEARTT